jgi:hypothetical protein
MSVAERARTQSRVFYLASQRCNEFRPLPSGHLPFLEVPTLVCYAFSIELGLKALSLFESGKVLHGHDLKALLHALSPALQAQIVADTGWPNSFESTLDMVRDAFEVWRYIHEKGHAVDTELGFLQRMAAAVQKALAAFPEAPPPS